MVIKKNMTNLENRDLLGVFCPQINEYDIWRN